MKTLSLILTAVLLMAGIACQQQPAPLTEAQKAEIEKEVRAVFDQWIALLNTLNYEQQDLWYSKSDFWVWLGDGISIPTAKTLMDSLAVWYAPRSSQILTPTGVTIKALSQDFALIAFTSVFDASFKDGKSWRGLDAMTMIMKKESQGWQIVHLHESWKTTD